MPSAYGSTIITHNNTEILNDIERMLTQSEGGLSSLTCHTDLTPAVL